MKYMAPSPKPTILFVHNSLTPFVRIDLELLRGEYSVREWFQRPRVVNLLSLFLDIRNCQLVFGWFASWHTFFPILLARLLKRPTILVVGGYDTANMPMIQYGHQRGGIRRWVVQRTIKWATSLITNSEFTRQEVVRNVQVDAARVAVVYHGLDGQKFLPSGEKENLVLTVGNVSWSNLQRKGLEPFVRAAALLPDVPFVVIGMWRDDSIRHLRSVATRNVHFTGWVSDQELCDYMSRARVYVQASVHEGFGLSVAEAMLFGCVPVVTRAGALPEVVGDAGIYVNSQEPEVLADAVRHALSLDDEWRRVARDRILREFPLDRRRRGLFDVVDSLLRLET